MVEDVNSAEEVDSVDVECDVEGFKVCSSDEGDSFEVEALEDVLIDDVSAEEVAVEVVVSVMEVFAEDIFVVDVSPSWEDVLAEDFVVDEEDSGSGKRLVVDGVDDDVAVVTLGVCEEVNDDGSIKEVSPMLDVVL